MRSTRSATWEHTWLVHFAESVSWRAWIADPLGLAVMLYIRDAADIGGIVKPNLPPLTPAVPAVVASVDRTRLAEQWNERWAQATGPEHFTGIGLEATTSPTFESTPELRISTKNCSRGRFGGAKPEAVS